MRRKFSFRIEHTVFVPKPFSRIANGKVYGPLLPRHSPSFSCLRQLQSFCRRLWTHLCLPVGGQRQTIASASSLETRIFLRPFRSEDVPIQSLLRHVVGPPACFDGRTEEGNVAGSPPERLGSPLGHPILPVWRACEATRNAIHVPYKEWYTLNHRQRSTRSETENEGILCCYDTVALGWTALPSAS